MKKIILNLILLILFIQLIFANNIDNTSSNSDDEGISVSTSLSGIESSASVTESSSTIIGDEGSAATPCTCSSGAPNENIKLNYTCGSNTCNSKVEVCQSVYGINDGCIPRDKLNVSVETKIVNSWSENNNKDNYTQYDATIINHVNRDIKQIYIYIDPNSFKLRDESSLWNMIPDPTKDNHLILPLYQQTINANQNFTFGFIIESPNDIKQSFNLTINQITFA